MRGHHTPIRELAFNHDGTLLASIDNEKLMLWDLKLDSWRSKACAIAGRNLTAEETWFHKEGQDTCAEALIIQAHNSFMAGQIESARQNYQKAVDLAGQRGDASISNNVCWYGALDGFHQVIMPACERAVKLAKDIDIGVFRDTRGIARALAGDTAGAIDDFTSYLTWLDKDEKQRRERGDLVDEQWFGPLREKRSAWEDQLKMGKNPIDAKTIRALRAE